MKKIIFAFILSISPAAVWSHSVLTDAGRLNRGILPNERLDPSSVTLQGNSLNFSTVAAGVELISAATDSLRTTFYAFTSTSDALQTKGLNFGTTHSVRVDELQADLSTHSIRVDELQADLSTTAVDIDGLYTSVIDTRTALTTAINSTNTAFNNFSSTSDAQQALFQNFNTTAGAKDVSFLSFESTSDAQQTKFVNFRTTSDASMMTSPATRNLDMSTYNIININNLQLMPTTYGDIQMYGVVTGSGTLAYDATARSLLVTTSAFKASWVRLAGLGETDISTGTIARFEFNEAGADRAYDSVVSTRFGQVWQSSAVWISSGIMNTPGVNVAPSTGITVADEGWMSAHTGNSGASGEQSISLWVYPRNLSGGDRHFISKAGSNGTSYEYQFFWQQATDKISGALYTSAGAGVSTILSSATVLNANKWNHVVWVLNKKLAAGEQGKLFVNNNQDNTSSSDTSSNADSDTAAVFGIGFNPQSFGQHCECIIDKVKYYNRALSPSEVDKLFNEVPAGYRQ